MQDVVKACSGGAAQENSVVRIASAGSSVGANLCGAAHSAAPNVLRQSKDAASALLGAHASCSGIYYTRAAPAVRLVLAQLNCCSVRS